MTVATSHSMLFAEAIRPLLDVAYRVAEQLTETSQQAEDCLVEAAMLGSQVRPAVEPGVRIDPWFLGLVVRSCGGRNRRWEMPRPLEALEGDQALPLYSATRDATWHDTDDDPARRLMAQLPAADIAQVLRSLPWDHRVVTALYYITQWSYGDIAGALGTTREELRPRLHRARRALQMALRERAKAAGILPAA